MGLGENRRANAGILSKLVFCWSLPLFWIGCRRDLEIDDVGRPLDSDLSQRLGDKLEKNWLSELQKCKEKSTKPSLLKVLVRTFVSQYILDGILICIQYLGCKTFEPLLLSLLLGQLNENGTWKSQTTAAYLAGGIVLLSLISVFLNHHTSLHQQQLGMRVRIACCSLLYRKILRLNANSFSRITLGQVINIMSNDVNRFDTVLKFLHLLWVAPIQIIVSFILYSQNISPLTFIGILFIISIIIPLQTVISRLLGKLRLKIARKTDERIKKMDETICGIQAIKLYAWEKPFENAIKQARNNEMKFLKFASYLRGINASFILFTERVAVYLTLIGHVVMGYKINASTVYPLFQFYYMLQIIMAFIYPHAISSLMETMVSIKRIQEFLTLEEIEAPQLMLNGVQRSKNYRKHKGSFTRSTNGAFKVPEQGIINECCENDDGNVHHFVSAPIVPVEPMDGPVIEMKDVTASWPKNTISKDANINDVSINFRRGKLYAVIGTVGAGKSTLLQLLLRELNPSKGSISVNGKISYASQEPWLFLATIRENILFGLPYDHKRYKETVRVCALAKDFQQFPKGDLTPMGERGVSLSGGQRARINLARAVYREADIYLLDDPLSGLDVPVGSFLFQECFVNFLRGKTRIIVTHHLQYLRSADYIIVLNNGTIENQGKYDELVKIGLDLKDCVHAMKLNTDEEDTLYVPTNSIREIARRISIASSVKSEYEEDDPPVEEDESEEKLSGTIEWGIYKKYWTAGKGIFFLFFVFMIVFLSHAVASSSDYWVTFWTNELALDPKLEAEISNDYLPASMLVTGSAQRLVNVNDTVDNSYPPTLKTHHKFKGLTDLLRRIIGPIELITYIHVYSALIILCICMGVTSCIIFHLACMNSSRGLHNMMLNTILKAPMRFFDTNPSGRILNRFSKDLGVIDELLPKDMLEAFQTIMIFGTALLMVVITNAWFLLPILAFVVVLLFIVTVYLRTAQDIKRLEGITRSPVFSHACATIKGISTIRSANTQYQLYHEFDLLQDTHTSFWYQFISCRSTFGFWLDIMGVIFIAGVTYSFIYFRNGESLSGDIGLAISQLLKFSTALQFGVRQLTEVLSHFTNCERIIQYTQLSIEGGPEKDNYVPQHWPSAGSIRFRHVSLNYSDMHKPVLENFNLFVKGGWKIGIIGRTGAGKSSLIAALFQLAKVQGTITIDDVDIETITLQELRKKISIIPQEPILFSDSIRYNLDPFGEHSDVELWNALESVYLKDVVPSLDHQILERGCNFSVGQRQLLCLARAILKNNKVLVLDEVTSNMDPQTDKFIQQIIRERFSECTVLTIAHRLHTIIDADRILAMDGGRCVEYKHPFVLLQDPNSFLSLMVNETGEEMANTMRITARDAYMQHQHQKALKKLRSN